MIKSTLLLYITTVLCIIPLISSLTFTVRSGDEICIADFVPKGELLTGDYSVQPGGSRVSINVFDTGNNNLFSRASDETGKFNVVAGLGR